MSFKVTNIWSDLVLDGRISQRLLGQFYLITLDSNIIHNDLLGVCGLVFLTVVQNVPEWLEFIFKIGHLSWIWVMPFSHWGFYGWAYSYLISFGDWCTTSKLSRCLASEFNNLRIQQCSLSVKDLLKLLVKKFKIFSCCRAKY